MTCSPVQIVCCRCCRDCSNELLCSSPAGSGWARLSGHLINKNGI